MSDYTNSGTADIDNILAQTAYQIPSIIHRETMNTEPWDALIPKSPLPTGVGSSLSSLVYNRSVPTTTAGGSTVGANWTRIGTEIVAANSFGATEGQLIEGWAQELCGARQLQRN